MDLSFCVARRIHNHDNATHVTQYNTLHTKLLMCWGYSMINYAQNNSRIYEIMLANEILTLLCLYLRLWSVGSSKRPKLHNCSRIWTGSLWNVFMKLLIENQGLLPVSKNQTSLKLLHLLYNAMREIDSHIWMLWESLGESILWFLSKVRPWFKICTEWDKQKLLFFVKAIHEYFSQVPRNKLSKFFTFFQIMPTVSPLPEILLECWNKVCVFSISRNHVINVSSFWYLLHFNCIRFVCRSKCAPFKIHTPLWKSFEKKHPQMMWISNVQAH